MKLKDISNLRTGLVTARKKASAVDKETYTYKAVTLKSFNHNGCLSIKYLDNFTSKEQINKNYLTQYNDILVRLREPNIAVFIDEDNINLLVPSLVATIRVDSDSVDCRFLTYYLNSTTAKRALNSSITVSAINMINTKELENLQIKLPSLEEQKKIVEFLDLTNKEIDLLEELKHQKEKYYQEVFNNILKNGAIK